MTENRTTYRLKGEIEAISGLAVGRPGENFKSPYGSDLGLSEKAGRLPRMKPLREDAMPYFPATSLRGVLRRATREMVRRSLIEQRGTETPWSLATHFMLTEGVDVTNQVEQDAAKIGGVVGKELKLRQTNPFLSLYGRWKLGGHLGVDNAFPEDEDCIYVEGVGARTNDFVRDPSQTQFLSLDDANRLARMIEEDSETSGDIREIESSIAELRKQRGKTKDQDEKKQINEQIDALNEQKKKTKDDKEGGAESIKRPIEGFEAIRPGTRLTHRMLVENADQIELGMTVATVRELARNPYVGAHRSLGCGQIAGRWQISYWGEDAKAKIVGEIGFNEDGFFFEDFTKEKVIENALSAWDKALSEADKHFDFDKFLAMSME